MKIYFLSSLPCLLTLNGAYFGRTDTFPRHAEVCAKDEVFVEFHPENALPIGFFITERLPFSPPDRCEVYLLPDAIAVYAKNFASSDLTLRVHAQKRIGDTLISVFSQGGGQVCVESAKGTFVQPLPHSFFPSDIRAIGDCFLLVAGDQLMAIDAEGKPILSERYDSFEVEGNSLRALLPLQDSKRRKARCAWEFSGGCRRTEFTLLQPPEEDRVGLIAYAFFESILLGEGYEQFLGEDMQKNAEKLPAFLGNFRAVLPTDDESVCHLVYQKAERLYEIKPFRVTLEQGKIVDIQG